MACSRVPKLLKFEQGVTLQQLIDFLKEDQEYQMRHPAVIANVGGKQKTLYMSMMNATHKNLVEKMSGKRLRNLLKVILEFDLSNFSILRFRTRDNQQRGNSRI